jgi:murein DD-endopeptidase MepM/ murein hydrolase activator NlpD
MGGYGWLVIVDHPEMNLYSLYGHLSPSRWHADPGSVAKGDVLGYLGDEWENGGSHDEPLVTHLHLGVRVGQRTDYPGRGEWRWMAGWIKSCPSELGWRQPSAIVAAQQVPPGGFAGPVGGLLERWWTEMLFIGAIFLGAVWWTILAVRKRRPVVLLAIAVVYGVLARYLATRGFVQTMPLYLAAATSFLAAVVILGRRRRMGDTARS